MLLQPMETALLDRDRRARVASVLVHVLHRLLSTFLLQKSRVFARNPGGLSTTSHHVHVIVATLHGATEWLAMLPRQCRCALLVPVFLPCKRKPWASASGDTGLSDPRYCAVSCRAEDGAQGGGSAPLQRQTRAV